MICKTEGPSNARIMLVGEAPGAQEAAAGKPFIGPAGKTLDILLRQSGIMRAQCLVTNVAREQPPGNRIDFFFEDKKCTKPKLCLQQWLETLKQEIILNRPNIVIALGATALWALCGVKGISAYRGFVMESSLVPGVKVLPTYHPQNVNYEWKNHFPVVLDMKKALRESSRPELPEDKRQLVRDPSLDMFIEYCDFLANSAEIKYVGVDLETTSPGCYINRIGLGHSPLYAQSIGVLRGAHAYWSLADEVRLFEAVREVFWKKPLIAQNGSFDFGVTTHYYGMYPREIYMDTHIAGHVCWPEAPRSLAFLTSVCCNVPPWKMSANDDPAGYNAGDVANMLGCVPVLWNELNRDAQTMQTFRREMAQIKPAIMLQLQGMEYDVEGQAAMLAESTTKMREIQSFITKMNGDHTLNINSPTQLSKFLYVDLGLPVQYKRKRVQGEPQKPTVDAEALKKLVRKFPDNAVLQLIAQYKKLSKLCSSFLQVEPSPEGRVHTCYNITGANMLHEKAGQVLDDEEGYRSFGRWSSSGSIILPYGPGNLQNIPKKARKLYKPGKGKVLVQADYKQAEAVVVAYLINDRRLKQMFKDSFGKSREECKENHWDVHRVTAATMYQKDVGDITDDERNIGKRLRHAVSYSAGPQVVAVNLGVTLSEAKDLLKRYHSACPQLGLWQQSIVAELQANRTLTNLLGRKHKFLERWSDELFRSAYSYKPQSTVGDLLNMALVQFYERYCDTFDLALQLHDAMYVIVDIGNEENVMERMKECMYIPLQYRGEQFTIDVDFSVGSNWGEMEEV